MLTVGVIDDEFQDLVKVGTNFLLYPSGKIQVRLYLAIQDPRPPMEEEDVDVEIASLQEELSRYHSGIQVPRVNRLKSSEFGEFGSKEHCKRTLARLASDKIDLIVCDSQIGSDEGAGQRFLESALSEEGFIEQKWSCFITSKQGKVLNNMLDRFLNGSDRSSRGFINKDTMLAAFPHRCAPNVLQMVECTVANRHAATKVRGIEKFGHFIGGSKTLNDSPHSPYATAELANLAARRDAANGTVLLVGEQGTGKEVFANAIHVTSDRADRPYVTVDCGNLNKELMGSELFGHNKNAFTGATAPRKGMVREADTGTLFLDEIHNLSLDSQNRLLRLLQEREVTPLGEDKPVKVNVRLIVATNQTLENLIASGHFKSDLFARLEVWTIHLPPLRDRKEDIPLLVRHFLDETTNDQASRDRKYNFTIEPSALELLAKSDWPENIRGLRKCIMRARTYAEKEAGGQNTIVITVKHVRFALPAASGKPTPRPDMTAIEIWIGIRDNKLQRTPLKELNELVGDVKTLQVLKLCKRFTTNEGETGRYFPGTTYEAKRTHESRLKKKVAKIAKESLELPSEFNPAALATLENP